MGMTHAPSALEPGSPPATDDLPIHKRPPSMEAAPVVAGLPRKGPLLPVARTDRGPRAQGLPKMQAIPLCARAVLAGKSQPLRAAAPTTRRAGPRPHATATTRPCQGCPKNARLPSNGPNRPPANAVPA